jgi:hypothetical protein
VAALIEVCERREVLTITPVVTYSQALADYQAAQASLDQAIATYNTAVDGIVTTYNQNMAGHGADYNSAVEGLATQFNSALQGIQTNYEQQVSTLNTAFQGTIDGLVTVLEGDLQTAAGTYETTMNPAMAAWNSTRESIETGYLANVTSANNLYAADSSNFWSAFQSAEQTASTTLESDEQAAETTYSSAVSGHYATFETASESAWSGYESALGDSTSGLIGVYEAQEQSEAALRDATLTANPGVTWDPSLVPYTEVESLWSSAVNSIQPGLDAAAQSYDDTMAQLEAAWLAGLSDAWATYDSAMQAANDIRNSAYLAADDTYNTNTQGDWQAWTDAVHGPGGIEETYQLAVSAADTARGNAWSAATTVYDDAVDAAADALQSAIDAANADFDDWLNGGGSGSNSIGASGAGLTITKTEDASTSPVTVTWSTSGAISSGGGGSVDWDQESSQEPVIPAGYTQIGSDIITISGPVTTTIRNYGPAWASGGGGTGGSGSTGSLPEGVRNNVFEVARYMRTELYLAELEGYYDTWTAAVTDANDVHQDAVEAANAAYMTTLYGNATGTGPFTAGTPAEAYYSALAAAYDGFTADEQSAFDSYTASMDSYWAAYNAWMMSTMDPNNPGGGTPPNPDEAAQYAKDYSVDIAAANVNYAAAVGPAWVAWVSAERAADTTRDIAIINADHALNEDLIDVGKDLAKSQVSAEGSWASDLIHIDADYAIAVSDKQIDKDKTIVSAVATFEKAEHSAAETLALSGHVANRDHAKAVASAADQKWFSMAEEDADLAKDLAAEEETRQIAYASADAAWINAEAAAGVAATAVAATANYNYQTGAIGAGVTYVSATAPLVTQAQQQFNAAFHQAYVTATGNDPGQSAVSSAWQQYADSMAANYQSLLTQAMTAWQAADNAEAQAAQALQNNIAGESIPRASSLAGAWTTYVGAVAPAATTLANNLADTGKALVQTLSSHAKNADHQDADNHKALADADAAASKQWEDDETDAFASFLQAERDAAKPHNQALTNEARDADQQANGEVTVLVQGGVDEKADLAKDQNDEVKTALLQAAPLEDAVAIAEASKDSKAAILSAAFEHQFRMQSTIADHHAPVNREITAWGLTQLTTTHADNDWDRNLDEITAPHSSGTLAFSFLTQIGQYCIDAAAAALQSEAQRTHMIVYLFDQEALGGVGHAALLIGSEGFDGVPPEWHYYSLSTGSSSLTGMDNLEIDFFTSIHVAAPSLSRYDHFAAWAITSDQAATAIATSRSFANDWYWLAGNNCDDLAIAAISATGINVSDYWVPRSGFKALQKIAPTSGVFANLECSFYSLIHMIGSTE